MFFLVAVVLKAESDSFAFDFTRARTKPFTVLVPNLTRGGRAGVWLQVACESSSPRVPAGARSEGTGRSEGQLEHSDYYAEGGRVTGQWQGRGAEMRGLAGDAQTEEFDALRRGLDP